MIKQDPDLCDICAKSDECLDSTNNEYSQGIIRVFCSRFEEADNDNEEAQT